MNAPADLPLAASPLVVPVDLTGISARLVHYAHHLGAGPLHLLHVHAGDDAEGDAARAALARLLAPWAGGAARVTVAMRAGGDVAEAVVAYAREMNAGLVVMGRPERNGVRARLLGREADAVLRAAPCPVLVMRSDARAPKHLLVAVDLTSPGKLLRATRDFRDRYAPGARLTALYVVAPLPYPNTWLGQAAFSFMPDLRAQAQRDLDGLVAEALGPDAGVECVVDLGLVAPSILAVAAERDADLIVVAPHRQSAVDRVLLGSVAERVVRLAEGPVLVMRGAT